jgi:hypothetical protein
MALYFVFLFLFKTRFLFRWLSAVGFFQWFVLKQKWFAKKQADKLFIINPLCLCNSVPLHLYANEKYSYQTIYLASG